MFLVVRKRANPIICRSNATSGSESSSISVVVVGAGSAGAVAVEDVTAAVNGPLGGTVREAEAPLGKGGGEVGFGGFFLGPVGGAAALVAFG